MIDAPQSDDDAAGARRVPVAIVGAGFSGTMVAAHLARRGIGSILIEANGLAGRGTAYSTREPVHVLNVRAASMSAWPNSAGDFVTKAGGNVDSRDFAPRPVFGRYLAGILDEAEGSGHVSVIAGRVVRLGRKDGGWKVELDDGSEIIARAAVLAIGNQSPQQLPGAAPTDPRVIANPWGDEARAAIANAADRDLPILIAGAGLTMVDTVLSLDEAGHRGTITAISRRGLIPRGHSDSVPLDLEGGDVPTKSIMRVLRWLRRDRGGSDWRSRVDGLRPHSHRIWQGLPTAEKQRFLRHARPWWDIHRHRIAPNVSDRIEGLIEGGRLNVVAGKIKQVISRDGEVGVRYRPRGRDDVAEASGAYLFNCTGPLGTIDRTADPMLRQMLDDGLARPDDLGIGFEVDARSRIPESPLLWAMGPLTKGRYWEMTAVPDIREQAAIVAADIAMELEK